MEDMGELREVDAPDEFDVYTLVLLVRPPDAPDLSDEEADRLSRQHHGHLASMREAGVLVGAGAFAGDRPDETWRGMCLYRAGREETRRLAEQDPAVRRGRLALRILEWEVPKGELLKET